MAEENGIKFTEEDWQRVTSDWEAWWEGELERPLIIIHEYLPTDDLPKRPGLAGEEGMALSAEDTIERETAYLERVIFRGDAWPKWWPNFGPGIVAGFAGAKVQHVPGTVWFEPCEVVPIEELHLKPEPENPWWQRVRDLTETAVRQWRGQVSVAHTDLGGNLDILASFRTAQKLIFELVDCPEEVSRLVNEITEVWSYYYDALYDIIREAGRGTTPWAPILSAGRTYMLQSDFAYMISPAMFEQFVMPDIAACCDRLERPFYHLDGEGQIAHLDMLVSLDRLSGVQWIPGDGKPSPDQWPEVLGKIRDAGKLCQLYVTPEQAMNVVDQFGGKGFALMVKSEGMSGDDISAFLNEIG